MKEEEGNSRKERESNIWPRKPDYSRKHAAALSPSSLELNPTTKIES